MQPDYFERLERTAMSMVVQALTDYRDEAAQIFREETDLPQDIAEDVMREALEAMGLPGFRERLYGKVDYKKAIYVFVPEAQPVALMLDAKAEKGNGSATIQMSQTSMMVRYESRGNMVEEQGRLLQEIQREGRQLHVVSIIAKYVYAEVNNRRSLQRIIVACIPNGKLQDRYNPTATDTIWRAGRHAPTLDEDFRVRLSYDRLKEKAAWRVQGITTEEA